MRLVTYISSYFWFHKKSDRVAIIFAALLSVLVTICNTCCPIYLKYMIELLSNNSDKNKVYLLTISLGYGLLWIFGNLFCRLRSIMARRAVLRCLSLMTEELFKKLLRSTGKQKSCDKIGLIERVNRDIPDLIDGFLWHIIPIFLEIVVACVVVVRMTDVYIATTLLIIVVIYLLYLSKSLEKITCCQLVANKGQTNFLSRIIDSFSNIEIVKLFNGYKIEENRFGIAISEKETAYYKTHFQVERLGALQFFIVGIGLMVLTCLLTIKIIESEILISDLVLVHTYLLQLTLPLGYFGFIISSFQRGMATFLEIEKNITNEIILNKFSQISRESFSQAVSLNFKCVCVKNNNVKILDNISLNIPAGKVTGITGLSGSGKTSLIRTITKQFLITAGSLYVNKKEIKKISQSDLISIVSIVPQEVRVFNDTILSNIIYGCNVNVHMKKLNKVLEMTNLSELINRLPEGLDTVIGNEQILLSKGEIQRITIARCLIKDAKIYIFDEPTSSLDIKNEQDIMERILDYLKGKTCIIVTHRLSLLRKTDKVIFMDKGNVYDSDFDVTGLSEGCLYEKLKPHDNAELNAKFSVVS